MRQLWNNNDDNLKQDNLEFYVNDAFSKIHNDNTPPEEYEVIDSRDAKEDEIPFLTYVKVFGISAIVISILLYFFVVNKVNFDYSKIPNLIGTRGMGFAKNLIEIIKGRPYLLNELERIEVCGLSGVSFSLFAVMAYYIKSNFINNNNNDDHDNNDNPMSLGD